MNESQRAVLRRYHQRLAEDLVVTEELLGEFFQAGTFPKGMIDLIRSQAEPDRVHKLLELLPKRGPDAFDQFVSILECTYPWLATLLASAPQVKPQQANSRNKTDGGHRLYGKSHGRPSSPAQNDLVDGDIRKLVQAFVHKQFGQSKRIWEKDKKNVEKFLSLQIQQERSRYEAMLNLSSPFTPCSDLGDSRDNMFQVTEVKNHLFSIHMKLEPHVTNNKHKLDNNNNNSNNNHTAVSDSCSCDGGDTHDNCSCSKSKNSQSSYRMQKLMPEDMDFQLIAKEVEDIVRHLELSEAKIEDSLALFDPRLHGQPLASLIEVVIRRNDQLRDEASRERDRVSHLLDECEKYSEHIEQLEKERAELRKQIALMGQDMGNLRQERTELKDKIKSLERDKVLMQQVDKGRDNNFRLSIVSKQVKTTPRGNGSNSNYHGGGGQGSPQQQRRYAGVTSRYTMAGIRKKSSNGNGGR